MTEVRVAVNCPLPQALTYQVNDIGAFERGMPVVVPLGSRKVKGVVLGPSTTPLDDDIQLKSISDVDETRPLLPEFHLKWLEWLSEYYIHPLGQVTEMAFPPLKPNDGKRKSKKPALVKDLEPTKPHELSEEQKNVLNSINVNSEFSVHLVHGVTGSGKTEIYLNLLERVLKNNQQGLMLVPEIALTPQLIDRFAERFGQNIAVLHSQLTPRERTNQWWSIYKGEKQILIGARSALFCPIPNLGLIIVDEEHEASYKQDESLKYHGRDAAVVLAKNKKCPVILGSATPSLETYQNCLDEKYNYHSMPSRVSKRSLPKIDVLALREESENKAKRDPFWLTPELQEAIAKTLERKEQVALFINRRGVSQSVLCESCGHVSQCPNCSIALTLHGKKNLVCHYCDYAEILKENCPQCDSGEMISLGVGTELVETDMRRLFPQAKVSRADRDEVSSREDYENLITEMENREIDILVGTQMIAKGLDFKGLTLVGLVLADVGFNMPDFRAAERNFQLITQMSGRSGRHVEHGGQVIVQTYNPEYPGLNRALTGNYKSFAESELQIRRELDYPPFGKLCGLRIMGKDLAKTEDLAESVRKRCEALKHKSEHYSAIQILGPAPAPLFKLRNQFRFHLLLKATGPRRLSSFASQLIADRKWIPSGTKVQVDMDPINLL